MKSLPWRFRIPLAVFGLLLSISVIPGVFSIDEPNHMTSLTALRAGRLTVPGTEGLPPTNELAWFDPAGKSRVVESTPIASTVPPLWAFLAWPFSFLGWRGLVALNTAAFLATTTLVFIQARRYGGTDGCGWWAATAFALGGFGIEYAQGLWPHCLSTFLVLTGTVAAVQAMRANVSAGTRLSFSGGALVGLAAGVRYQNLVVALALAAAIVALSERRSRTLAAFLLGLAIPLLISSTINHARYGSFNPVSKGPGYLRIGSSSGHVLADVPAMVWGTLVDYAMRPPIRENFDEGWLRRDPETNAWIVRGVVKKALFQSAPWLALSLTAIALASGRARSRVRSPRDDFALTTLLIAGALVMAFSLAGRGRHDGVAYNARYLMELVPLGAVLFGSLVASRGTRPFRLVLGGAAGCLVALATFHILPNGPATQLAILYVPLAIAATLVVSGSIRSSATEGLLQPIAAMAITWALFIHLGTDLSASRVRRAYRAHQAEIARRLIPREAAVFTCWGRQDSFGAVILDHPLVLAYPCWDDAATVVDLAEAFRDQGRRTFVWLDNMPSDVAKKIAGAKPQIALEGPDGRVAALEILP